MKRRATPISANDRWIACHALAIGATVVSHNVSEFSRAMNAAYAFQAAELVGIPPLAIPYQAAGFEALAKGDSL